MLSTTASTVLGFIAQNGGNEGTTDTILWIIAAVLVIAGIVDRDPRPDPVGDRPGHRRACSWALVA